MWEFSDEHGVFGYVDERGGIWDAQAKPLAHLDQGGVVRSQNVIVGYVEPDGEYWGRGMRYLGWVERSGWSLTVRTLGFEPVLICNDASCARDLGAAIGLIAVLQRLRTQGELPTASLTAKAQSAMPEPKAGPRNLEFSKLTKDPREHEELPWNTAAAPRVRFPNLVFVPESGRLASALDCNVLASELLEMFHKSKSGKGRRAQSYSWTELKERPAPGDPGRVAVARWLNATLAAFGPLVRDVRNPYPADAIAARLPSRVLDVMVAREAIWQPRVAARLASTLAKGSDKIKYAETIECVWPLSIPHKALTGTPSKVTGFTGGWIQGWQKSLTLANRFEDSNGDWRLASECLDVDPEVRWWVRLRPGSRAKLPVGKPGEHTLVVPDFLVIDADEKGWLVLCSDTSGLGRDVLAQAVDRWIRSMSSKPCGRRWSAVIALHLPTGSFGWRNLTHEPRRW